MTYPLAPPMGNRDAAGKPYGFLIEAMEEAARRTGDRIEWRVLGNLDTNDEALRRGDLDLIAGFDTEERRRAFYVTDAWWSSDLVVLSPATANLRHESDLYGRRLAIPGAGVQLIRSYPGSTLVPASSAVSATAAACSGVADAAVIGSIYVRELLAAMPPACQGMSIRSIDSTVRINYALTARRENADAARRLKSALDAITADGTLARLAAQNPPISTPHATRMAELLRIRYERRVWLLGAIATGALFLVGAIFALRQRLARVRLERSDARFRALFDAAPQAVLAVDGKGLIVFANRSSQEIFARDLVGAPAADLLPERFRDQMKNSGGPIEVAALRPDGAEFAAELRVSPVDTREGWTLVLLTDISARVALQRQLLQSQKLESVGLLAGGVAHDFNNLLTVISGYTSMALDQLPTNDFLYDPLQEIAGAADRAASLTRQLLAFSRRQAAEPKLISLQELLLNLEKMLRRLIGENIEMVLSADPIPAILADPGQVEQVVVNLIVNARDAMPQGGRIEIHAGLFHVETQYAAAHIELTPGDYVLLSVRDNGIGMTPETQAHVFEPFFTTKEQGKGTGLGLSTVYGIVKQSGGDVLVYSELGRGTTFKVFFPAAPGVPELRKPAVRAAGDRGHETILLAEDEPGVRRFVKEVLAANGYTVLEAGNGREALEIADRHTGPIHLLLTDLVMPEMGGLDLSERMAQIAPAAAVLYMSGYSDRPLNAGVRGAIVEKPFTPSTLLERVRQSLRPAQ